VSPPAEPPEGRLDRAPPTRALLVVGAVLATAGLALSGSFSPDLGGLALILGWLVLGVGIHRFGRLGAAG
jgi:hypothetical protein